MHKPLPAGHLKEGALERKTYGEGHRPKHGAFERKNANQGVGACPNLECCRLRAVARVKALRKKRNAKG